MPHNYSSSSCSVTAVRDQTQNYKRHSIEHIDIESVAPVAGQRQRLALSPYDLWFALVIVVAEDEENEAPQSPLTTQVEKQ